MQPEPIFLSIAPSEHSPLLLAQAFYAALVCVAAIGYSLYGFWSAHLTHKKKRWPSLVVALGAALYSADLYLRYRWDDPYGLKSGSETTLWLAGSLVVAGLIAMAEKKPSR